jgi:hypothetical protein
MNPDRKTKDEMITKEEVIAMMKDGAESCFERDGTCNPFLMVFDSRKEMAGMDLSSMMGREEGKNLISRLLGQVRTAYQMSAMVSEAWVVKAKVGEQINVPLSNHPDREEVVLLTFYFGMEVTSIMAPIIRTGSKPILGPWAPIDGDKSGRFIDSPADWN